MKASAPPREARTSGSIDPRIRARRADVLRTEARRRLRVALAVLAAVVVVACGWFALHSRLFAARVVTVVGAVHTPAARIVAAAGLADHPPLLDVGASAVAGVERLPWVAHAAVARQWPDGVRITVTERVPVAAVAEVPASSGFALVDRTARVLAVTSHPPPGLVQVGGVASPGAPGSTSGDLRAGLRVVASLPAAFAGQVSDVREDQHGDVTLQLTSALTVYLGSTAQLPKKYEDIAAILKGATLASGSTIDVAAPATPVVKP
ncbi:MAG TPA: FtsQ-type POTRA domain-containing protein [Acidimicrobiales bacterium]|nr:FtsQ-type POTRA domain-containing protein [Acidimicrobiales bacterium]